MVAVEQTFTHLVKILHPNNILSPEDERKTDFRLLGWVCKSGRAWGEGCPFCWHAPAQSALALLNSTPQPPRLTFKAEPLKVPVCSSPSKGKLGDPPRLRNIGRPFGSPKPQQPLRGLKTLKPWPWISATPQNKELVGVANIRRNKRKNTS